MGIGKWSVVDSKGFRYFASDERGSCRYWAREFKERFNGRFYVIPSVSVR